MSRYRGPKLRIVRRLGELPGLTTKTTDRLYPPGQHGNSKRRAKKSEYAIQLMEKQKAKYTYGILEKQFKNIYDGSKFFMDPTLSMDIQQTLNSDIAMILDSLIDINKEYDEQLNAINTTQQWANTARNYHTNNNQSH